MQHHEDHTVYVAVVGEDVVGWFHSHRCVMAISPTLALIFALAVDDVF
ncbi:MAG: hypothetical protein SVX43_07740 [Cyanobacteriota bacterium]|nr:hypothetical protein [Cyanobacteriota bacterium]